MRTLVSSPEHGTCLITEHEYVCGNQHWVIAACPDNVCTNYAATVSLPPAAHPSIVMREIALVPLADLVLWGAVLALAVLWRRS